VCIEKGAWICRKGILIRTATVNQPELLRTIRRLGRGRLRRDARPAALTDVVLAALAGAVAGARGFGRNGSSVGRHRFGPAADGHSVTQMGHGPRSAAGAGRLGRRYQSDSSRARL
jgi:hypothetical protein